MAVGKEYIFQCKLCGGLACVTVPRQSRLLDLSCVHLIGYDPIVSPIGSRDRAFLTEQWVDA